VDALRKAPGVVVLHEYVLHHLVAGITIGRGDHRGYLDAMERELGVPGRLLGLGVLDNLLPLLWETQPERFPLSGSILDSARGLIVHSQFVAERARVAGYDGRLWRIPHPAWPTPRIEPAVDFSGDPLIGCFGFLNMNKRIPQLLEAFASLRRRRPGARLLLAGATGERFDLGRRLERLGLAEGVDQLDYVPEERMWALMAACDVLVNLRYPTMGETSGSVIRALSLGKALVVSDVGWFAELPDEVVLKVPVDEFEVPMLEAAIGFAAEHRAELGAAARAYVQREHALPRVVDAYVAALEVAAGGDAVDDQVLRRVAEAAAFVGLGDPGALARAAVDAGIVG
jgi:glycosyltransferase involved in cell wall biosynthesis